MNTISKMNMPQSILMAYFLFFFVFFVIQFQKSSDPIRVLNQIMITRPLNDDRIPRGIYQPTYEFVRVIISHREKANRWIYYAREVTTGSSGT